MISAEEALQIGLVNFVVDNEKLQSEGERLMQEILCNAPLSLNFTWEALHRGLNVPLEESVKIGADYFGLVASTGDFKEGTGAFLTKRKPSYHGR
jgi:enoyl-CoA hydratase